MRKIVITGGHHSSALPVIAELREKYPAINIYWFGHKHSMWRDKNVTLEYQEITALNIPFVNLRAGKLYKTYNILRLLKLPIGFIQALYMLVKIRPDIILSFGGYLGVPVVLVGKLLGFPSATHEQTVVIGYANAFIEKFADKVFYSWPSSEKYLPKTKSVFTGLPIRREIFTATSNAFLCSPDLPTIYITAGKSGSHFINMLIHKILKELLTVSNIIHQCGDHSLYADYDLLQKKYVEIKDEAKGTYNLRKFVHSSEIGEAYAKADFVVSRAGAHTIYELLVLKKPAVVIPISWVSHNEQNKNAALLKGYGLAKVLDENELTADKLLIELTGFISKLSIYKLTDESILARLPEFPEKAIVYELEKIISEKKN